MATQTLEFSAGTGLTLSCKLFAIGSDTVVDTQTATEKTNDKNRYSVAFTDVPAGAYRLNAFVGATGGFANEVYDLTVTTATFQPRSESFSNIETDTQDIQSRLPTSLVDGKIDAFIGQPIQVDIANEVGYQFSVLQGDWATVPGVIADGLWDEAYAGHTTAGTFGKLMDTLRKANMTVDGVVTSAVSPTTTSFSSTVNYPTGAFKHAVLLWVNGSSIAEQNSPILTYTNTNGVITVEEAFTSAPQVGDEFIIIPTTHVHAIAAIQSGLATSSGVTSAFTEIKGATWSSSTDTLEAIRDASGGGGTTIIPAASFAPTRTDTTNLIAYVGETINQILVVYQSDGTTALDLSGKTLTVVFEDMETGDTGVVASASVTVSGDNNNIVTFAYPSAVTDEIGQFRYALRDEAAPKTVYSQGLLLVKAAANKDA